MNRDLIVEDLTDRVEAGPPAAAHHEDPPMADEPQSYIVPPPPIPGTTRWSIAPL